MELQSSIADSLCKTCRAAGLPQSQTHSIVNEVAKWYRSNGLEWTVERLKDLHHWYITREAGVPNIPNWVAHHSDSPKGPFRCVFSIKNKQKALAVLSLHTAFYHEQVSSKQLNKLLDGLNSAEVPNVVKRKNPPRVNEERIPKLHYESPTLQCLTGVSIPAGTKVYALQNPNLETVARAYMRSWQDLPGETAEFLRGAKLTRHAPEVLLARHYRVPVGTLSCIQEPSLKARWISNPNRITQHFMRPLGEAWGDWLDRFPTDCTKIQDRGVNWARTKLKAGMTLAAADLTSATDKLNLSPCLDMVHKVMCGNTITEMLEQKAHGDRVNLYLHSVKHFYDVSRGDWMLNGVPYAWKVGWPLGTRPSFPLLGLVNNICAMQASQEVGIPWKDSFRVLGDDIVMDARILPAYTRRIESLGGVVNPTKSIVSDKAVEFAGRVIEPQGSYLKRVKARDISDDSFMELMQLMGDQAKWLLKPRQRKVWEELRYIPGIAVDGPRSQESHGEPLALRYLWYLRHVDLPKVEPDIKILDAEQMAVQMVEALRSHYPELDLQEQAKWFIPRDIWEGVHPSKTAYTKVQDAGDPRRENGKSALEVAEARINNPGFVPYQTFKRRELGSDAVPASKPDSQPPDDDPPPPGDHGLTPKVPPRKKKSRGR